MNYAEARQREDKSGWAFTIRNNDRIWTAECCRTEGESHQHATREDAEECFNAWRCDPEGVKLNAHTLGDWTSCVVCDAPTKAEATHNDIGRSYVGTALCDEHMTVENVIAQVGDVTQVVYS